ncbi:MAG: ATP-dependent DNA helicase RecQ, partial [Acidobacteriaceae bacterium]|nr:ATP-dependent DNA helicase RecQ [Acidobacteriaceae bacterium]
SAFGFRSFRANQEAICQAVVDGKDTLVVMPTGSGKSLCYQLPGLARGGTTLVISPLIALMEDQVTKLRALGFAVDRIHSGRDRAASRQVCLDYLSGKLQFLFIAPERLRVSGFPEMLAKRIPSLVAIDEAHCISQWGHDFRPDYRMLGQHLPRLRPSAVIALTATATPPVQRDICEQLGLEKTSKFVSGFRRENIAIEVVEAAPSQRASLTKRVLMDSSCRPAIVYTQTRKAAEDLADELRTEFPAAPYHAGLDAAHRQTVQQEFLDGKLEVMVATIAFGMGIDKPNVRTVIHTALPGSLEGYYQEIGRAGRDGAPSRALLMHSYADRHTHDFFLERDYPPVEILEKIYTTLTDVPVAKSGLQRRLKIASEVFDKAIEKLWTHGGACIDAEENITRAEPAWRKLYVAQGESRSAQIEHMLQYAASDHCRMSTLVRHFGDHADSRTSCGVCDFCAPDTCIAQEFREPSEAESALAGRIVAAIRSSGSKSTGKLYSELCKQAELTRDHFEQILGGLARGRVIQLNDSVFEKDGKRIPYRVAALTADGRPAAETTLDFTVKKTFEPEPGHRIRKKKRRPEKIAADKEAQPIGPKDAKLEAALRAWRLAEAKRRSLPAFRIFTDQVLQQLAQMRPETDNALRSIKGIGNALIKQYGAEIRRIIARAET